MGSPLQVLTDAASNLDPTPRARALRLLITTSAEPGGGDWAPRALHDPDPWVQRHAAMALVDRLPETEAQSQLVAFLGRDGVEPYVRGAAALRLGAHDKSAALGALEGWNRGPLWEKAPLALAAASVGDPDGVTQLSDALERGEIPLEVEFVLDLADSGLTQLVPALRTGSERVEEELVLPYAVARISLGDPSGEGALRKALTDDDEELRLEALDYLSELDAPASNALLKKAKSSGPDLVRWYARLALASRDSADGGEFTDAIGSNDPEVRLLAVRFAVRAATGQPGRKHERTARRVVRDGLVDPSADVRREALRGLAELGLQGEEPFLQQNLEDEYLAIRIEAAGTMMRAGL